MKNFLKWFAFILTALAFAMACFGWVDSYQAPGHVLKIGEEPSAIALTHADGVLVVAGEYLKWDLLPHPVWAGVYRSGKKMIAARYRLLMLVALVLWAAALTPFILDARKKRSSLTGHCPRCNYDVRAHHPGDRCPECGTPVPENSS